MQKRINVSIIINCPPSRVFASLIDLSKWQKWGGGNLVCMEQVSPGLLQVGSQIRQINKVGNKQIETLVQVTDLAPEQIFGIARPNLQGAFTLVPVETGTRLNAVFEVEAIGISALMYRLFLEQFVKSDLRKFKTMVETS